MILTTDTIFHYIIFNFCRFIENSGINLDFINMPIYHMIQENQLCVINTILNLSVFENIRVSVCIFL